MVSKVLLIARLALATALLLPNPRSSPVEFPGSIQAYMIHSRDFGYRFDKRAVKDVRPAAGPKPEGIPEAPRSKTGDGLEDQDIGLSAQEIQEIHNKDFPPNYKVEETSEVLTEEPKPGDGETGVYNAEQAREIWMDGVRIRSVQQTKGILSEDSGSLLSLAFDLSALSTSDAADFRLQTREAMIENGDVNGLIPFKFIDQATGQEFWGWPKAGSQSSRIGNWMVEEDGKITTEGEFKDKRLDKDGAFTSGNLKGWKLKPDGYIDGGPYKENRLNSEALVVQGPLEGFILKEGGEIGGGPFQGSKIGSDGVIVTGPTVGFKIKADGTVTEGLFEGEKLNSEGFFTTGKVKGFRLSPDGTIRSPEGLQGLKLTPKGAFGKSEGAFAGLEGLEVNPDATLLADRLHGLQLIRDGDTIAFTGVLTGFKLGDPKTNNQNLIRDGYYYFITDGPLREYVLRSDGFVWKMDEKYVPFWMPLLTPRHFRDGSWEPAGKFDISGDKYSGSGPDLGDVMWNAEIDKMAAALKEKATGLTNLKRGDSTVSQLSSLASGNPSSRPAQSNVTNAQQQIEEYIAFYTACQANVSTLIRPIVMSMLASPPASPLPLLRLAAASLYTDLTRSNILISGPFWMGMYHFDNFTADATAANVSQARLTAINQTNYKVADIYLEAWGNATRLLNSTTLEGDMDLVASYLKPKDPGLLPQSWTNQTPWDPNIKAFFPEINTS